MVKITKVICFMNGMVMVFDDMGNQVPDYQGLWIDVVPLLDGVDLRGCEFFVAPNLRGPFQRVSKDIILGLD